VISSFNLFYSKTVLGCPKVVPWDSEYFPHPIAINNFYWCFHQHPYAPDTAQLNQNQAAFLNFNNLI